MYFVKTPAFANLFYPGLIWRIKDTQKNIYLTFDDGPDEKVTPAVLSLLDKYQAKATFFCVGEKVKQNPEIYNSIIEKGHQTGNHSYNHLKGNKSSVTDYLNNVKKAAALIQSTLFRPPYGKISPYQIKQLRKDYKIIMWSVLPGDFERKISKEEVLSRSIKYTKNGSIIVLHDNSKFYDKMMFALEGVLEHFQKKGYKFKAITEELL